MENTKTFEYNTLVFTIFFSITPTYRLFRIIYFIFLFSVAFVTRDFEILDISTDRELGRLLRLFSFYLNRPSGFGWHAVGKYCLILFFLFFYRPDPSSEKFEAMRHCLRMRNNTFNNSATALICYAASHLLLIRALFLYSLSHQLVSGSVNLLNNRNDYLKTCNSATSLLTSMGANFKLTNVFWHRAAKYSRPCSSIQLRRR